jgi:hypothetical protein
MSIGPADVSFATIVHNSDTYDKCLQSSLSALVVDGAVDLFVYESTGPVSRAKIFNHVLDHRAKTRFVAFCHPEIMFGSDFLDVFVEHYREGMGCVGFVGKQGDDILTANDAEEKKAPVSVEVLDECLCFVDRKQDMHFDDIYFRGLHMAVTDLCMQQMASGRENFVFPFHGCQHMSSTLQQRGKNWGTFVRDFRILVNKWRTRGMRAKAT